MEIKKLFAKAIEEAARANGGKKKLAALVSCPPNYFTRWANPDKYKFLPNEENLKNLIPFLEPYLPVGFDFNLIRNPAFKQPSLITEKKKSYTSWLEQLSQSGTQNIIAGGVINVYGIPLEKIQNAIKESNLTQEQKDELILKIFS